MSKNKKIIIVVGVILLVFLCRSQNIIERQNSPPPNLPLTKGEEQKGGQTILYINNVKYEDKITEKISVYDFMDRLRKEKKINFTERDYIGMGKFIVSINDVKGNDEKNWIYYVNGKKAEIGVSNYKINPGDVVSWKYEKVNY